MRKRNQTGTSKRQRPRLSSLSDMITNSENTMLSSQATVISGQTQRSQNTQSYGTWNEIEN